VVPAGACTGAMSSCERPADNNERRVPSEPRTDLAAHREDRPRGGVAYYRGVADWWGRHVWVERDGIRGALSHHGDAGVSYAWGRSGPCARELARALLFDATGNAALSERYCRDLTHEVLAHLPDREFVLRRDEILAWIAERPGETSA
jgi:hypothetical protein